MLDFEFEEEIEVIPEPTQPIQNMFDIASLKVKKEEKIKEKMKREKYFMKIMVNILAGLKIAKKMK